MDNILNTLSVVSVIWIIAAGFLIFVLLFLFAKRQIMRFTLKSRRGPYVSIGSNVPKSLRQEIFRRLDRVPEIKHEPKLLNPTMEQYAKSGPNHFYYRMKAMDAFSVFDETLRREVSAACRHPNQTMRDYLTTIYPEYLSMAPTELVTQFIDLYEHARHKPEVFEESHYIKYSQMLGE
ncbi:protein C1orf43 homolog, partial [Ruditapes philippinarum]|uniref:protein C1orf43 homolog n=1 Tax=Ruditapes philippinarum TaxID=129788 RepID=UPI00295BDB4F